MENEKLLSNTHWKLVTTQYLLKANTMNELIANWKLIPMSCSYFQMWLFE